MGTGTGPNDALAAVPRKSSALLKTLGSRIRTLRNELGLTQEQLAGRTGMAPESVSRLEGGRLNISVSKLGGVAEALGVSVAELFSGASTPSTTLRSGERRIVVLLEGLDDAQLKAVHAGLKHLLSVAPPKRPRRKPTSRR